MDKENYLEKLYNYLTEHNYCLIKENRYAYSAKAVKIGDPEYFTPKGYLKEHTHSKLTSVDTLLKFAKFKKKPIEALFEDTVLLDFFISSFKEANKEEKVLLLKNIEINLSDKWVEHFNYIFNKIIDSPKNAVSYFTAIPISVWEVNKIPLKDLDAALISHGVEGQDYDNFYLKFFKSRKNQINNPSFGQKVKNFLLEKYSKNDEILKLYSLFFNYIKDLYEDISLDIYEEIPQFTIVSRLNCRKAAKLLCVHEYNELKIKSDIKDFVIFMKEHKNIEKVYVDEIGAGVIEVLCYTNNQLTRQELNTELTDFLLFKKKNIDYPINKKSIESYYLDKSLRLELIDKKTSNKKMKL